MKQSGGMFKSPHLDRLSVLLDKNQNIDESIGTIDSNRDSKLPKIKKKKKLRRMPYSLKNLKKKKITPQFIKDTSLRLHLSTKNKVKSSIFGAVTTPSSLRLTQLQSRIDEL